MAKHSIPDDELSYDHLDPVAFIIPVPLVVLMLCDPLQLSVWIALRWLAAVFPDVEQEGRGFSHRLIVKLCKINRRTLAGIFTHLLEHELIYEVGRTKILRATGEHPHYAIDIDHLQEMTRDRFSDMLARWHISNLPRQVPREQMQLFEQMSGAFGNTPSDTSGAFGNTPSDTSGAFGNTPSDTSGAFGNTPEDKFFTFSVKGHELLKTILVPVVVFEMCDPSELATWITHNWLLIVNEMNHRKISGVQVAYIGSIARGRLKHYYPSLLSKRLMIHVGTSHQPSDYTISHRRVFALNAQQAVSIFTKWKVNPDAGRPAATQAQLPIKPARSGASGVTPSDTSGAFGVTPSGIQHSNAESSGAFGNTLSDTSGASGVTPSDTSGAFGVNQAEFQPSLKRNKLKKGSISLDPFETPECETALPRHPLQRWQDLNPHVSAADLQRLQRYATQHDAPIGAYPGGFGTYWLGRAIEKACAAYADPTVDNVRIILTSWRNRTTADTSAYGTDKPGYRQRSATRPAQRAGDAPASTPPVGVSVELAELWQRILGQLQEQIDRSQFDTWLRESLLVELNNETAIIAVSNIFAREKVTRDYGVALASALSAELGRSVQVMIVIGGGYAA